MSKTFLIRPATIADKSHVTQLFRRSYPDLLSSDYDVTALRGVLPHITKAQPALLACGTYFLAVCAQSDQVVGAGGWTDLSPTRGVFGGAEGHVRHVATHPDWVRIGVARALIDRTFQSVKDHGITRMHCMSTRTARPFYAAVGFREIGEIELTLAPGVYFPAIQMVLDLVDGHHGEPM